MEIEQELKINGIEIIEKLDEETVKSIALYVTDGICNTFPNMNFNHNDLFNEICSLSMYIANIPIGLAEASYFYKNSSIYFRDGMGLTDLKKFAIHEIIHHIQEEKNEDGSLKRLGLCEFNNKRTISLGLNESAVQIISSCITNNRVETVKYYGIELATISPDFYPLICNLMSQICYLVGESILYDSTFYSNDNFKNTLTNLIGINNYLKIQRNFDNLILFEEKIAIASYKLLDTNCSKRKSKKYKKIIIKYKSKIKNTFLETQNLIFISYFDRKYNELKSDSDIEIYKNNLLAYKNLIGISDDYHVFDNYLDATLKKLDIKHEQIINNKALIEHKPNKLISFFHKIFK